MGGDPTPGYKAPDCLGGSPVSVLDVGILSILGHCHGPVTLTLYHPLPLQVVSNVGDNSTFNHCK